MANEIKEIIKVKNAIYNAIDDLGDKLQDYEDDDVYTSYESFRDEITDIIEEGTLQDLLDAIENRADVLNDK